MNRIHTLVRLAAITLAGSATLMAAATTASANVTSDRNLKRSITPVAWRH